LRLAKCSSARFAIDELAEPRLPAKPRCRLVELDEVRFDLSPTPPPSLIRFTCRAEERRSPVSPKMTANAPGARSDLHEAGLFDQPESRGDRQHF
jgi:hypothetical protein